MSDFNEFDRPLGPEKDTGSIISHAWENYKKVIGYGILLMIGVSIASSLISTALQLLFGINANDPELMKEVMKNKDFALLFKSPDFISSNTISYVIGLFFYPLYAGFIYMVHKANNNKELIFSDLFIGYRQNTFQIILYSLLSGLLMGIGFVLCIIPVIIVGSMLLIGLPVVFFENKTAIEGIQKSFEISKNNLGTFLGIAVLSFLLSISGALLCCIGIVATAPFMFSAIYSTYSAYCGTPYEVENT